MRKDPKAYQKRMDKLYSHTMHDYITKEIKELSLHTMNFTNVTLNKSSQT